MADSSELSLNTDGRSNVEVSFDIVIQFIWETLVKNWEETSTPGH